MKSKIFKIFLMLVLIIFIVNIASIAYATTLEDALSGGKDFIKSGKNNGVIMNSTNLKETSNSIYNTLLMISFVVVAVVGISLGIKFMTSGVEEKADVKKSLVVFVIGCIVIYGAFGIWKVLVTFLNAL